MVKINVGAAWQSSSCCAGAGIVTRNANGEFLGAKAIPFLADSASMAEAQAAVEGCRFAIERSFSKVCFESDSRDVVQCINGNIRRGRWNLYPILSKIKELRNSFAMSSWRWINRIGNQAADHLASLALSRSSPEVLESRPPTSLVHVLNNDGLPCPPGC
ncbi:hypothetical protein CerSpe_018530 [Prunus speciosa]